MIDNQFLKNVNLLKNPGFENGDNSWSASTPAWFSITKNAADVGLGVASGVFTPAGSGHFQSSLYDVPNALRGKTGAVGINYKGGQAGIYSLQVVDGSDTVLLSQTLPPATDYKSIFYDFTLPSSGQIRVKIASSGSGAAIYLDQFWLGTAERAESDGPKNYLVNGNFIHNINGWTDNLDNSSLSHNTVDPITKPGSMNYETQGAARDIDGSLRIFDEIDEESFQYLSITIKRPDNATAGTYKLGWYNTTDGKYEGKQIDVSIGKCEYNVPIVKYSGKDYVLRFSDDGADTAGKVFQFAKASVGPNYKAYSGYNFDEYAYNNNPNGAAGATYNNSSDFKLGAEGTPFIAVDSVTSNATTNYVVQFSDDIRQDDELVLEININPTGPDIWVPSSTILPYSVQYTSRYGMTLVRFSNDPRKCIVSFGNRGDYPSNSAYSGVGSNWSSYVSAGYRWRVRRTRKNVGLPILTPDRQYPNARVRYYAGSSSATANTAFPFTVESSLLKKEGLFINTAGEIEAEYPGTYSIKFHLVNTWAGSAVSIYLAKNGTRVIDLDNRASGSNVTSFGSASITLNKGETASIRATQGASAISLLDQESWIEIIRISDSTSLLSSGVPFVNEKTGGVVPAGSGYIVETGSNSDGEWIKWSDGTMICSIIKTDTTAINSAWGGIYVSPTTFDWAFPQDFTEEPRISASMSSSGTTSSWMVGTNNSSPLLIYRFYYAAGASLGSASRKMSLIAIGKWK